MIYEIRAYVDVEMDEEDVVYATEAMFWGFGFNALQELEVNLIE